MKEAAVIARAKVAERAKVPGSADSLPETPTSLN